MRVSILIGLLLVAANSYGAATVDCESEAYTYSPAVHEACVEMQQTTTDARKNGNQRFSKILAEKKAAVQAAIKANPPPPTSGTNNTDTPRSNSTQPTSNVSTPAPPLTPTNITPTAPVTPNYAPPATTTPKPNAPTSNGAAPAQPTPSRETHGVNYY
jgi:hypothetical protein